MLFRSCLEELHVLDYKLALKYSVEERNETLLGVFAAEDALERPIDTWVDIFRHINEIIMVVFALLRFGGKVTINYLDNQEF